MVLGVVSYQGGDGLTPNDEQGGFTVEKVMYG